MMKRPVFKTSRFRNSNDEAALAEIDLGQLMAMGGQDMMKPPPIRRSHGEVAFFHEITTETVSELILNLKDLEHEHLHAQIEYGLDAPPPIKLTICSDGGDLLAGIAAMDHIRVSRVPIHTYVQGTCSSAATLISIAGHKRFMGKHAFMLIHQLRTWVGGKFDEVKEEVQNCELFMETIRNFYLERTNLTPQELDALLKREMQLTAQQCLEKGLIDQII